MSTADTLALLLRHRSIRRFRDEPVPDADILAAVQAGQAASTSSAVQAYCLIQVTDPAAREALVRLTGNQRMVASCGAFFVVCGDTRRHRLLAERAGQPYDTRLEAFLVAAVDATLFAQNAVIAFEAMGYGICYVGGLRNDLPAVDALLGLPDGVYPLYGLCVGRPDQEPAPRPRLPAEAVCMKDRYHADPDLLALVDAYDETYRAYMQQRSGLDRSWSEAVTAGHASPKRTDLARYYRGKGASLD